MTVAFISARARRAGVALGAVSAGLLVLSACDKPTPIATVTIGTDSVHSEAACYQDGKSLGSQPTLQKCLNDSPGKTVSVSLDDPIHFGVDPSIAHNGWTFYVEGQRAEAQPNKDTYRTIQAGQFFASQTGTPVRAVNLSIVETSDKEKAVVGVWNFELKQKS
ncbi:DUF2771 domain-containing protein [Streptomyces sp. NBC_01498]|uniref:DUF2771 domain-containing protein n=1 Tax=Streptomyces sp. NBC_01498 TaxID=2975870 RepID=UPI002E7B5F6F|nr:DUF2771 domain-containing protein [Streptomyces sp. NBC_01498]WTL26225.1 DUF2771 domain-containing protein [Streptomyces sp. NBC_01498]